MQVLIFPRYRRRFAHATGWTREYALVSGTGVAKKEIQTAILVS